MQINDNQRSQIISQVQSILNENFNGPKTEIKHQRDRLNFACPYCGDSSNVYKKRANIYWKNLIYHCFNDGCGKHTNIVNFFKDYNNPIYNTKTYYCPSDRCGQLCSVSAGFSSEKVKKLNLQCNPNS
jgi:hypothetical protein